VARFGWWSIRVNRLSGRSASDAQSQQFADVLPVGTRDDVERVLRLFLPGISAAQWQELVVHGLLGPHDERPVRDDPAARVVAAAAVVAAQRCAAHPDALLLRRGSSGARS
jgi:putative membrane protein